MSARKAARGGVAEAAQRAGAIAGRLQAAEVEMMLAEVHDRPFNRPGWVFEVKLDGYRLVVGRDGDDTAAITRNGHDLAVTFPEISRALLALPHQHVVLDGEVVAVDARGRPSFQRLQQRGKLTRAPDVARAAAQVPVLFYVFDLLAVDGLDLRPLPLLTRKELLREVIPRESGLHYLDHYEGEAETLFRQVVRMGLEGIVAKRADSAYHGGRSPHWRKIRADQADDFVVVGYSEPKGTRQGFGALHVGQYVDGRLVYSGRVGTGFTTRQLSELHKRLTRIQRESPSCEGPVPPGESAGTVPLKSVPDFRTATWVEPALVAEVRYKELTEEGYLRQPAFLRMRDDKPPEQCVRQLAGSEPALLLLSPRAPAAAAPPVKVSNRDKIFWPGDGYTKGDLVDYYQAIAPWLMPYLAERPLVLTRYPDGIEGKNFFQKDAPKHAPAWLRTERLWSENAGRDIDYFVCNNADGLVYLANLAAIPLHIWASRFPTITHPDWCSLDLDPKDAPFEHVIEVAQAVHDLCRRIRLPAYIKTTGSSGLHVLVPLARRLTHDQARSLGEVLAQAVVRMVPKIATLTRAVERRRGKVYVDYLQNGHGKLLVAPFSVRPIESAPVSMPLRWDEVREGLRIRDYTIRNAVDRMNSLGRDPLLPVLDATPDLEGALARLGEEVKG